MQAFSALHSLDKGVKLDRDSIITLAKNLAVEGGLVTGHTDVKVELKDKQSAVNTRWGTPQLRGFRTTSAMLILKCRQTLKLMLSLAADLYILGQEGPVLGMQPTSFENLDMETIMSEATTNIVSQLKRDNIL